MLSNSLSGTGVGELRRHESPSPPGAPARAGLRLGVNAWRLVTLAVLVTAWQIASIPAGRLLLPPPGDVMRALFELAGSGQLLAALGSSLQVLGGGYGLAVVAGIPLGMLMGGIRPLGESLEIYVNGLNSTPRVAFIPLIVLWFGLDTLAKVIIVWITAVFPIIINTYAGVLNADRELVEAARSFGARPGQIFRWVLLPSAVPYIVAGLRIGASLAIIGTVVAELYTALSGLGHLLETYSSTFQTARYFVPVLVLMALGTCISVSLKALEHRLARWRGHSTEL